MAKKLLALLVALCIALGCLAGCTNTPPVVDDPSGPAEDNPAENPGSEGPSEPFIDYAAEVVLDFDSDTAKQEVTVRNFVDGDTTHFHVPTEVDETGLLKARYLAVNTPESTGKIEEWGKKASAFTKEKLSGATSIYIESEDGNWNLDSTGGRYLPSGMYQTQTR